MNWKWLHYKKKNKEKFIYKFLCKNCDIFVYRTKANNRRCPLCYNLMEVYDARPAKKDK